MILAVTVLAPLVLSLVPWRFRWRRGEWCRLVQVFLCVSVPFVLLDSLSHTRGWWAYEARFITGPRVLGLPIEELLFFFVVPFACLYLYSALRQMLPDQAVRRIWLWRSLIATFMVAAAVLAFLEPRERTVFDGCLFIAVAAVTALRSPKRVEVVWLMLIIGLFLVVNSVLTALPIVTYDEAFGSRYRLGTIPFEDVLYNFSFLVLCLAAWQAEPLTKLRRAVRRA